MSSWAFLEENKAVTQTLKFTSIDAAGVENSGRNFLHGWLNQGLRHVPDDCWMFFTMVFIPFTYATHSVLWTAFASSTAAVTYTSEMSCKVESQHSLKAMTFLFINAGWGLKLAPVMRKRVALKNYLGKRLTIGLVQAEQFGSSYKTLKSLGNKRVNPGKSWRSAPKSTGTAPVTSRMRAHPLGQSLVCSLVMKKRHCLFIVLCGEMKAYCCLLL